MKHIFIYACLLLVSAGFFSCTENEEVYSCDKTVDAWVRDNLSDIQKMTRTDWLNLDARVNRAVYIALTPEQKYLFWKEKMVEVLALDWNEVEKKHIESLYETISDNPQWFAADFRKNEKEQENFELFTYKWIEHAKDNLGWDMKLIGSMIASGNKMLNTRGTLQIPVASTIRLKSEAEFEEGYKPKCQCNTGDNWCSDAFPDCKDLNTCATTTSGCGWFLLRSCDGECK